MKNQIVNNRQQVEITCGQSVLKKPLLPKRMALTFDISVSTLGGHLCTIHARRDWYGRDLKAQISELTKTPQSKQKLLYGSQLIRNVDLLEKVLPLPDCVTQEPLEILLVRQSYDLDYWLDEINRDYKRLRKAPEEIKADRHVVMAAIEQDATAIKFASDAVKADKEVAMKALAKDASMVNFIDMDLWEDCDVMMAAVPRMTLMYRKLSPEVRSNRELTVEVLKRQGEYLQYAPAILQADKEVALIAARGVSEKYKYNLLSMVSGNLLLDKEVVVACAENGCSQLQEIREDLRADEDVLRALVTGNPMELDKMPAAIKGDRSFVLELLRRRGDALKFAGEFCDDRECVEAAVRQSPFSFEWASVRLRGEKDVALLAIDEWTRPTWQNPAARHETPFRFASKELRADREVVLRAVAKNGISLALADATLRMDREVVTAAINENGIALEYVLSPKDMDEDSQGRSKSGKAGYRRRQESVGDLLQDVDLLVKAVKRNSRAVNFCPKHLRKEVEELVKSKR